MSNLDVNSNIWSSVKTLLPISAEVIPYFLRRFVWVESSFSSSVNVLYIAELASLWGALARRCKADSIEPVGLSLSGSGASRPYLP